MLNGVDGAANAVDAVTDGVRKVAVEEKKLYDAIGDDVGGVDLAVSFEGSTAAEQAHQFKVLVTGAFLFLFEEIRLVDLEHGGGGVGALEIAAQADELPTLAMNHGGIADAFEEVNSIDHGGQ